MRLLLDECMPKRAKTLFAAGGHSCTTVQEAGFTGKENGELLRLAENAFDVLLTLDRGIQHQQNISGRQIAVLIIRSASNDIDDIQPHIPDALLALQSIRPGIVLEIGPSPSRE